MTWGAVAGAAVGVVGSAMTSKGGSQTNGGAGTQTQTKEPWAAAQPWIMNNLQSGQALQNAYTDQPFSALQNQAYQNQSNQSAYMRAAVPSLLGQMSGQQLGFDRSNPNARPTAFNFDGANQAGQAAASQNQQGLLAMLNSQPSAALNLNANTPQVAPKSGPTDFVNQTLSADPMTQYWAVQRGAAGDPSILQSKLGMGTPSGIVGGLGSFKYGQSMPQPGTQAYKDMNDYFAYGGADPYNFYGKMAPNGVGNSGAYGNGSADANSSGSATGAAASDGSGGGTAF